MICTSIQNKTYQEIADILARPEIEMAEIRLDRCQLSDDEIESVFADSDTPLIATCRAADLKAAYGSRAEREAERRLLLAVEAGARFADLEIEAPAEISRHFQKQCRKAGTELIRSYHNFDETPSEEMLQMALARCFRYGADIAKVVTTCHSAEDAARIESLYSIILEDVDSLQGKLIAFGMGAEGRDTRLQCLKRGAPFTYAALTADEATAPGQWSEAEMRARIYDSSLRNRADEGHCTIGRLDASGLLMPSSKSFAQRAIIAAALAEGTSHLGGYTPCGDSEAAIDVARALGATVTKDGRMLTITGIGPLDKPLDLSSLHTGESGLLTRLMIPLVSVLGGGSVTVEGRGTLLRRPLGEAGGIMAAFGVLLSNAAPEHTDAKELFVPVNVKGRLIPGTADVSGSGGSQLISGLLMALPLCGKDSTLFVADPKSIPYMYITPDVLRHFGISTRSEMEGNAEMLEAEDWSYCTGITFSIHGGQHYKAADFDIESDWSAAANFLVAGAIYGSAELDRMDTKSLQADISIIDILVEAGAMISQVDNEDGTTSVGAKKAPLEAFSTDLNNAPDLFPIVAVLAAFCAGESRIAGVGRLASKESNRAEAILNMLQQAGVEASIEGDELIVEGETLTARILHGTLLKGGEYTTRHDHRMAMALKVASMGAESPVVMDDEACVAKSFPEFFEYFKR